MDGFITESVAKISEGFFASIKLLFIYFLTKVLFDLVNKLVWAPWVIIYLIALLAIGGYELHRSLATGISEQKRTWKGMAAGVLFWQSFVMIADVGGFHIFQHVGILLWVMILLATITLWHRVLPPGVQMTLVVLLVCWFGKIYFSGYPLTANWPPAIGLGFATIRIAACGLGILSVFYIIFRSRNVTNRSLAAIAIFNAVLFLFRIS
jgi:hypothetical protein